MERFIINHGDIVCSVLAENKDDALCVYARETKNSMKDAEKVFYHCQIDADAVSLVDYLEDAGYEVRRGEDCVHVQLRDTGDRAVLLDVNDPLDHSTWLEDDSSSCPSIWDEKEIDINRHSGEVTVDEEVTGTIDSDGDYMICESYNEVSKKELANYLIDEWNFYHDCQIRDHLICFLEKAGYPMPDDESDEA